MNNWNVYIVFLKSLSMKLMSSVWFSLAALLLAGAACVSVPDADEMAEIRASAADARIQAIDGFQPLDGRSDFLQGPLSLEDAIARAIALNLPLRQKYLERDIAAGKILSAAHNALPSLDASASYTRLDDDLSYTDDLGVVHRGRFLDRYAATLRLAQPLFNGRVGAALRAARLYSRWAEASIEDAAVAVRADVIRTYFNAVLSERLLDVQLASLATAERQLSEVRARRKQGMASNYDELRATVEVSNFQAQCLQARNDRDLAYTALYRLLGSSPESKVQLTDPLPLVHESVDFERALRTALANRADLAVAEYALRMQQEALSAALASYWPDVSLVASQSWANPDPHDSSRDVWGDEWQAGVQLSWTLFDGLARRGEIRQARAALEKTRLALVDAEEAVVSEVRQRVLSLQNAAEFAQSQSKNLETAKEALRLVEVGLREGQNSPVEVMDARQALTTASANYYRSIFDHAVARVLLQQAMGLLRDGAPLPDAPVLSPDAAPVPPAEPAGTGE